MENGVVKRGAGGWWRGGGGESGVERGVENGGVYFLCVVSVVKLASSFRISLAGHWLTVKAEIH